MKTVSLTIDGKDITAPEGEKVLWAALDNDIYIPNLCAIRERGEPFAACRLCFVEIEGYQKPVTSCTEPVREGMVVNTRGKTAQRLARTSLELMLSDHDLDCAHCPANKSCELQKMARHLGVKLSSKMRFKKLECKPPVDSSGPLFVYNPNKCVLCGRCVWVCEKQGTSNLGFAYRGFGRMVTSFYDEPLGQSGCGDCRKCLDVCPVGALSIKMEPKGE